MVKSASSPAPRFFMYSGSAFPGLVASSASAKTGDRIELDIQELRAEGDGWARIRDSHFIVRRTLPGDRVEATVRRKKGRTCEATADCIKSARITRVAPNVLISRCAADAGCRISVTATN